MKPDLPKRLAAKIRGAQAKVTDARASLFWGQHKLMQVQGELKEFALNPVAYANSNYPGYAVDSYPVVTRTSRLRESEARNIQRGPERVTELRNAEAALAKVESEVLQEVGQMRATLGRVPWPAPLPDFETFCAEEMATFEAVDEDFLRERAAEDAQAEREEAEYHAEWQRQSDEEELRMRLEFLALPLEEQEKQRAQMKALRAAIEDGRITINELLDWVQQESTMR